MLKKTLLAIAIVIALPWVLIALNVLWTSPKFYSVADPIALQAPIMDMAEYQTMNDHRRPYTYEIKSRGGGKVYVLGVEHSQNASDPQMATIRMLWTEFNPTVALVEGRLGFLFSGIQDPVEQLGEGGLVKSLADKDGIRLYTWEPSRDDELKIMVKKFPSEKLAMFYALRPYFSNLRFGKPTEPEQTLQQYIEDRTDYDLIRGKITTWQEIDAIWKRDFPGEKDWRDYSDEGGWPPGYLFDIWNESNLLRDIHLCQVIADLVQAKEAVFVTMGASHAPRIEKALRATLQ